MDTLKNCKKLQFWASALHVEGCGRIPVLACWHIPQFFSVRVFAVQESIYVVALWVGRLCLQENCVKFKCQLKSACKLMS